MIDQQTQRALAYIVARCRPVGSNHTAWDEAGIVANLAKVANLDLADVALAAIRAAQNPKAASPGVIPVLTGEHWRDKPVEQFARTNHPPKSNEVCPDHGGWALNCAGCAADRFAGDEPPKRYGAPADPAKVHSIVEQFHASRNEGESA